MKKIFSVILLLLSFAAFANDRLIFDQTPNQASADLPEHFRLSAQASGSAQFNRDQLTHIINKIPVKEVKNIYIVDLRQESHGFMNNSTPVSLYGDRDWSNKGLDVDEVMAKENKFLKALSKTQSQVLTEKQLVESMGLHYERIVVTDHMAPTDEEVMRFLSFYHNLPQNAWLHFHCHGGDGRTTTFLVMNDILQNSQKDTLQKIILRQYKLGGEDLMTIPTDRPQWFTEAAKARLIFLQKFYEYVHSGNYKRGVSWQAYLQS